MNIRQLVVMMNNGFANISCNRLFLKASWIWVVLFQICSIPLLLAFGHYPSYDQFVSTATGFKFGLALFFVTLLSVVILIWGLFELVTALVKKSKVRILAAAAGIICILFAGYLSPALALPNLSITLRQVTIVAGPILINIVLGLAIAKFYQKINPEPLRH